MSLAPEATARIEALAEQLTRQADRYRAVLALAERQQHALARQDMPEFNALLEEKAVLMAGLADVDQTMAENRAAWEAGRDRVEEELRERLRGCIEEIRTLLKRLLDIEQDCEAQLQAAKSGVADALRQVGQGRRALQSYRAATPPAGSGRLDVGG